MVSSLIERYKKVKKRALLSKYGSYKKKYAFVGVGNHSLSNLYPIIDYLGLPLKYICTRTLESATPIALKYNCEGTNDFSKVLKDPEIEGVFICTASSAHFELVKKALSAGKNVFVDKPPCLSSAELEELDQLSAGKKVVVGVQKRYSKVYKELKKRLKTPISYNYKYLTGAYPEGNPIWDLFIHPLDVVIFLFGSIKSVNRIKSHGTFHIQITHDNGVIGTIELSTDYTWDSATEKLVVVAKEGVFQSENSFELSFQPKSKVIMGVPLEKVISKPQTIELLVSNNGFIPTSEYNALHLQGFYDEIKTFVDLVEGGNGFNQSSLQDLKQTFKLIEQVS